MTNKKKNPERRRLVSGDSEPLVDLVVACSPLCPLLGHLPWAPRCSRWLLKRPANCRHASRFAWPNCRPAASARCSCPGDASLHNVDISKGWALDGKHRLFSRLNKIDWPIRAVVVVVGGAALAASLRSTIPQKHLKVENEKTKVRAAPILVFNYSAGTSLGEGGLEGVGSGGGGAGEAYWPSEKFAHCVCLVSEPSAFPPASRGFDELQINWERRLGLPALLR